MTRSEFVLVLTTLPSDSDPLDLATTLVQERLAACVNVAAEMTSVYRWEGNVEQEQERQIVLKTTTARLEALWTRLRELHPYEVPEFIVLPITDGSEPYLRWMRESTTPDAEGPN